MNKVMSFDERSVGKRLCSHRDDVYLGAIRYEQGFDVDQVLRIASKELTERGFVIAGVVQRNSTSRNGCSDQMELIELGTQKVVRISQNLGFHAQGCRLDQQRLADVSGIISSSISAGSDFVFINKFGKAEAEGYGLLSCIGDAIKAGIPVLTAVRSPYIEAWQNFQGGLASELSPVPNDIIKWCVSVLKK